MPELPSLFDEFFTRDWFNLPKVGDGGTLPAVNVKETDNSYELEVAAPGMTKNDFKIELDNNMLVIWAQKENSEEEKDPKGKFTRREFSYRSFRRSFSLPERLVDGENISARYADGILYVSVPKTEAARVKPARRIEIS